jgi:hypothetical protein
VENDLRELALVQREDGVYSDQLIAEIVVVVVLGTTFKTRARKIYRRQESAPKVIVIKLN